MTSRYFFLLLSIVFSSQIFSQNFAGQWSGNLTQDGKTDKFIYEIELVQHENRVSGTATSRPETGDGPAGKFEIGGQWDGETLTLQEVKQLAPEGAKWCLKHIRLKVDGQALRGSWEAQGCTPGWIVLSPQSAVLSRQSGSASPSSPIHQFTNSPIPGRWAGQLSQSDRDYGFFFEMTLAEDGKGTSRITSDGPGGNATHALRWSFDEAGNWLEFEESEVLEKSNEDWPWCIKSGRLFFQKETNRLSLAGDWEGYIEGHTPATGACAPGKLYLERPIFQKEDLATAPTEKPSAAPTANAEAANPIGVQKYERSEGRKVQVDRVLEVRNKTVKIAVWDNGTVDGDVLSLFVNGNLILENYRATRRKKVTIVELDQPTNYLILHALNLGSITPNTVAVSVNDGSGEQVIIMSSNLRESGAVMLREFRVGE